MSIRLFCFPQTLPPLSGRVPGTLHGLSPEQILWAHKQKETEHWWELHSTSQGSMLGKHVFSESMEETISIAYTVNFSIRFQMCLVLMIEPRASHMLRISSLSTKPPPWGCSWKEHLGAPFGPQLPQWSELVCECVWYAYKCTCV